MGDDARVSVDDGIEKAEGDPSIDDAVKSVDDADDVDDASMPQVAVVAQGLADTVSNIIDSNYGTPAPTPAPTEKEDNAADDVVNKISETAWTWPMPSPML